MDTRRIFIVEDDEALRRELASILALEGIGVVACEDFACAAREAIDAQPDAVILDLRLPSTDGLSVCQSIRAESAVPILVLTSSEAEFDEVMSMRLGADDYLTKPYSPAVLLAHVGRLLQRADDQPGALLRHADIALDPSRALATYGGRSTELSRNETCILAALIRARGAIVSRQDLMFELWQSDEFIDDNTLTVNVNRLRRALAQMGVPDDLLKTHRGQGYSL